MPPLVMKRPRPLDLQLLAGAVLVPADVGDEDRVVGRGLATAPSAGAPGGSACRRRAASRFSSSCQARLALGHAPGLRLDDGGGPRRLRRAVDQRAQRRLGVADDADVDRRSSCRSRCGSMSIWISLVFGEVEGVVRAATSCSRLRRTRCRRPGSRRRCGVVSLAARVPQMPVVPTDSGSFSGKTPLPIRVVATGACSSVAPAPPVRRWRPTASTPLPA